MSLQNQKREIKRVSERERERERGRVITERAYKDVKIKNINFVLKKGDCVNEKVFDKIESRKTSSQKTRQEGRKRSFAREKK